MLGVNLLNHTLACPLSVVGYALHIILSGPLAGALGYYMFPDGRVGLLTRHMLLLTTFETWLGGEGSDLCREG